MWLNVIYAKLKSRKVLVSGARMAGTCGGSHSISQGPLGSYSSHVCASSFRICSLAGASAV